jgi:hypothetical protein
MISLAVAAVALGVGQGDRWAAPVPRVFASVDGLYAFKVIPTADAKGATGTLFNLDATGAERVIWSQKLVCLPVEARVSGFGHVATMDYWGTKGKDHALVVYDRAGKVVVDRALKEIFPGQPPEKNPYFLSSIGSIHWTMTTEVVFDKTGLIVRDVPATASGSRLFIRGVWGETIVFDPDTGKEMQRKKL